MNAQEYLRAYHAQLEISRSMEVRREEYLDYMTFRRNERPLFTEIFGPLLGLKEEWAAQGATPAELDFSAFRYQRPIWGRAPVNTGWLGGEEPVILEETEELIVARDQMGRRVHLSKKAATLPLPIDHPVKNMDDWRKIKHHYAFSEERFAANWEAEARRCKEEGRVVTVHIPGGYDEPRQLMGDEGICLAFYEQPELVHDMLETIGQMAYAVLARVASTVQVDELHVHEDMAGNRGPLIGPKQVREFIAPYYRRVWDMLQEHGARVFRQDSDGDMRKIIPAFLEAGVNCMYPVQPTAHMDLVALRAEYGNRLAFMGGLDKHVLLQGEGAIVAELEYKIPPMVDTGGSILGMDHRLLNGTPLAAYRFYIQKVWEILDNS
jgi:uroporphyrinogen-III decarboxylase